jgi:glycosyltransferase involved in cell wall biosynthesis
MRILIITQAVDMNDTVLGFFHSWLQEFSHTFENVEVICLKEGEHAFPPNVRVHSLGKEKKASQFKYIFNFYRYILSLKYDGVFIHMNEEYVLLGGWWWKLFGKRIVLWRNFATGSFMTPLAATLSTAVCYTSPDSFTSRYSNSVKMPIGIDTNIFKPHSELPPLKKVLVLGRLDAIKRVELFVGGLLLLHEKGIDFDASVYGNPTYPEIPYVTDLIKQGESVITAGKLSIYSGIPNTKTPEIYTKNAVYVNVTTSGSFDKTIGEAMGAGCIVVTCNSGVREVVPGALFVEQATDEGVARALESALSLTEMDRKALVEKQRNFIIENHSLKLLAINLRALY